MMSGTRLPIRILRYELTVAIGLGCTMLPISALAQTATPVDDPIKQLQSEIRNVKKIRGLAMMPPAAGTAQIATLA
jgi:hypothetical protein